MAKPAALWLTLVASLPVMISTVGASESDKPASRPNILFAIADDMGHAGAYGTRWVKTPNFDRLASRGILFLNAYTPNAKCSPAREMPGNSC